MLLLGMQSSLSVDTAVQRQKAAARRWVVVQSFLSAPAAIAAASFTGVKYVHRSFTLVVIAVLWIMPAFAFAQSRYLSSPEETRKAATGIAASVASGNYPGAMKELRSLSVIPAAEFDVFEAQVNSQVANLLRQFGTATGYEFLREEKLGTRLLRLQFLVFHQKAALRWNFVFYKAEKGWVLSHFHFDGNALSFFPSGG